MCDLCKTPHETPITAGRDHLSRIVFTGFALAAQARGHEELAAYVLQQALGDWDFWRFQELFNVVHLLHEDPIDGNFDEDELITKRMLTTRFRAAYDDEFMVALGGYAMSVLPVEKEWPDPQLEDYWPTFIDALHGCVENKAILILE